MRGTIRCLGAVMLLAATLSRPARATGAESLALPEAAVAAPETATVSAVVDTVAAASLPIPGIRIDLERGRTIEAALVVWHSDGYVLAVFPDGHEELIAAHKIRHIVDAKGRDRAHFVIDKRGAVGSPPPNSRGQIDPSRFHEKKGFPLILGVPLFIVAILAVGALALVANPPDGAF